MRTTLAHRRPVVVLGSVISIALLLVSLVVFVAQPSTKVKAADLSPSYSWNQLKIGGGGFVTGLAIHPTTAGLVYARTDVGGAYRWNESTQTWTQLLTGSGVSSTNPDDYNVESIAVSKSNDQVVYIASGNTLDERNGRILKSTNRGATWTDSGQRWSIAGNGDYRTGGEQLAVDPNNDNVVYFGSRKEGLWVSTNAGAQWNQVSGSQIPIGSVNSNGAGVSQVTFDPTSGTIGGKTKRIYVGVGGAGLYQSTDAGASWSKIFDSSVQVPYSSAVAPDGTFYMGTSSTYGAGVVEKYNPSNGTWTDISPNTGNNAYQVTLDPFNNQRLFVCPGFVADGYLWRTTDGGAHWDTLNVTLASADIPWILNTDEENYLTSARLLFDPLTQNRLWFAQGTGVWRSSDLSDSDVTLNFVNKGIEEFVASDVIAPTGGKPVTAVMDRNGFYHNNVDAYPGKPILTNKFAAGLSLDYSGGTPSFIAAVSTDTRNLNPDQSGYSTDGGATWTQFSGSRNYSDLYGGNIAVSATDTTNIVWLPTGNRKPYYTTNQGGSWTQSTTGLDNLTDVHRMIWWIDKKALDADKVAGGTFYLYATSNSGTFYRSTNGGQTWTQTASAPPSTGNDAHVFGQVRAVPGKSGHVWVSVAQDGLYYTTNKGDSWTHISNVQQAKSFGFGKAIGGSSYPAIYINGQVNNEWGIWRSADQGASWDKVAQYPGGLYSQISTVSGDMNIAGRVYVGFSGTGFVYGDSSAVSNPTPTPTPILGTGTGLKGEYYNSVDLTGPVVLTRTDPQVNFDWGGGSPAATINSDNFSARWTGQVQATVSGSYTFSTTSDDGIRLWVDGSQIINNWADHGPTTDTSAAITLTAGQKYDIKIEYHETSASATAKLLWSPPGLSRDAIPQSQLYPASGSPTPTPTPVVTPTPGVTPTATPTSGNGTGLKGDYYNSQDLSGSPVLTRTDAQVNFDWGSGSPGTGVSADHFSVRWTGQVQATVSGNYTFSTTSDDGIRLWVNGSQIINNWTDHGLTTDTSASVNLTAGQKYTLTLEFYENAWDAIAKLLWTPPGGSLQAIPQSQLYPTTTSTPTPTPTPTPPPSGNLALNKATTTSGGSACASSEGAANAVDGSTSTKWCQNGNGAGPYTLQVDLGASYTLTGFTLRHAGSAGEVTGFNTSDYQIQVSTTGSSWNTVVTVTNNNANVTTHSISSTQARYVRLLISKAQSSPDYPATRLYEFAVTGS